MSTPAEGVVRCLGCKESRLNGDGNIYCRMFEMLKPVDYACRCTAFRPVPVPVVVVS